MEKICTKCSRLVALDQFKKDSRRHASKLKCTPPWLTEDQLKQIESYCSLAKELQWLSEEPLEVDHIVPLQGENVSGLHVPWNLQILPKSLNCSKGNKLEVSFG